MSYCIGSSEYAQRSSPFACAGTITLACCRYTLRVMGIEGVVRLPPRWLGAAGVALVTALTVAGAYVEANPAHRYGGLHLTSHPPLAAYLLLGVPAVALIWRNSRPVEVLGLAVAGTVGWAALGQIDGAALVPVVVGVYWVALTRTWRTAAAAGLQLAADPASAAAAIQAIRSASKSGLRELRTILEVLRQVDGGSPAAPAPARRAIAALVEATSAAGTPTRLELAEPPVPLPPPVTLAIYRIVQESLTNVVRHAGRVAATVGLRQDGGYLHVDVVNDGGAAPAAFSDGTGAGRAGMRERAVALGGTLDAGPRPGGGFAVHARLPIASRR
jgi:two-component sensor histidine kinase